MQIRSVGIDLGETMFDLVALGTSGKVLVKKKFSQKQLLAFTANMQTALIGLEACSGAHFLGRALRQQGHDARLIPAQFVKPFVKSNKNDFVDAEAIAEAVERNLMVKLWDEWKTVEEQIDELTHRLEQIAASDAGCCRIRQIPGIGPIVATAIVAAIGIHDCDGQLALKAAGIFDKFREIIHTGGQASRVADKDGMVLLDEELVEGALEERKMVVQLGRLVFLSVLANPKSLDFRFESRPWNPEFGSRA